MNNYKDVLNGLYGKKVTEKLERDHNSELEIMSTISNLEAACEVFSKYRVDYLAKFMGNSDEWRDLYNKVYDLSSELWRVQSAAEEREEKENEESYERVR